MNSMIYYEKLEQLISEGIINGVCTETVDTTISDLRRFQDFLDRNFKNFKDYDKIKPTSNHLACLYASAKKHKFNEINNLNIKICIFHLIINLNFSFVKP